MLLKNEKLIDKCKSSFRVFFRKKLKQIPQVKKVKGKGLMLGIEFDFEVAELRKKLIFNQHIFTGGASNKNLLRILPPLNNKKRTNRCFY